jgi:hypothetical protein
MSDSSDGGNVVEILTPAQRERELLQLRLSGVSVAELSRRYRLTDRAVLKAIDKQLPALDATTRARYLKQSIATLDLLQSWWTGEAKRSPTACGLLLKILDQRAQLLGLQAPLRLDPIQVVNAASAPESSTAALLRELDRIAGERAQGGPVIEAEAEPEPPAA